jgi:hypothetical protein
MPGRGAGERLGFACHGGTSKNCLRACAHHRARMAGRDILSLGRRRFGPRVIPLPRKLLCCFFDPCDYCCRRSVGRKDRVSPADPFKCFHRGPRFRNTPGPWRHRLRLLTGEYQSALYVTALQTLQRVVLEAGDRHGVVLLYLRHIHFCRAHQAPHHSCSLSTTAMPRSFCSMRFDRE